ncbi:hypothetical protein GC425_03520 [Corynebacterium sp. zg254]|uniref:Lipoprotein LpqB n=1 Tax=Corynebacterium zhongnanshanii TaxID=2768834 RepID=A0ABQ6VEZ7_9CORY|nr:MULTISPECIES: LpqB family beta-propeller domain-containing protein [Corynebacterium]KAB3522979.1 hypothetical protein F8377_02100 [Corynebacterium zhongnanshanii]MCR5913938.1 hypothetical protein [Corynebacterium sp. zg254]
MTSSKTVRCVTAAVAASSLWMAVGCTSIPESTKPEAISSYAPTPDVENVPVPVDDRPSDLLLRDFMSASAHPTGHHKAARAFLTPSAADAWRDAIPIMILERTDITSVGASDGGSITYRVRGNMVGQLGVNGAFRPELSDFEAEYRMTKVDGQWRISDLPDVVVMERSDFVTHYTQRKLYFMEQAGNALVSDPRWVYNGVASVPNTLMFLLTLGPSSELSRGVRSLIPSGVTARVTEEEHRGYSVDLLGMSDLNAESWEMLAAQVVWTLASSDLRGPYKILAEGTNPVSQREDGWQVQHVSQFDPNIEVAEPLRMVAHGAVYRQENGASTAEGGWLSDHWVDSLAVSGQRSMFAAVTGEGDAQRSLMLGEANGVPQTLLKADSITRPSWTPLTGDLYAVSDGDTIHHFTQDSASGAMQHHKIDASSLEDLHMEDPKISVFRVSRSGARALMVINGRVFVSVLETGDSNRNTVLGKPLEIGYQLGDTAVSADWRADGSIIVGTRANDAPLWQLSVDGSEYVQLPSRNLNAPVVAVAAEGNTLYATDSRALMQYNSVYEDQRFWREVPSVQGLRSVPVLPY